MDKTINSEKIPVAFGHRWPLIICHIMQWHNKVSKNIFFPPLWITETWTITDTGGFLSIITRVESLYSVNGHLRLLNCDSCSMKEVSEWSSNALIQTEHYQLSIKPEICMNFPLGLKMYGWLCLMMIDALSSWYESVWWERLRDELYY